MADWGLRVRNPATGSIQVDQDYWNLALLDKATLASASAISADSTRFDLFYTVSSTDAPLVAIASTSRVSVMQIARSGNNWTYHFCTESPSQSVTIYRFGRPADLGPGWGVRVKKASSIRYDSRQKYARVDTTLSGSSLAPGSSTRPSGRTYAVMIAIQGQSWYLRKNLVGGNSYSRQETREGLGVQINGNLIEWSRHVTRNILIPSGQSGPAGIYDYAYPKYSFVVLDVTDF